MQIQHMSAPVDVFKKEHIPEKIAAKIAAEFGDDYLLDSNMIVFYRGEFNKDQVEKLFSITNKAFGEDANRMTLGDFKKFSMDSDGPLPQPSDDDNKGSEDAAEQNADAENQEKEEGKEAEAPTEQSEETRNDGEEEKTEEQSSVEASSQTDDAGSEEDEEDKQLDKEVDDIVNGGDSEEQVNEDDAASQQKDPVISLSNAYLFLKITVK